MTNHKAIQWLIKNNAVIKFVTIAGYNFFRIAVKDRVFHISIFEDEIHCSFGPAVTFFKS